MADTAKRRKPRDCRVALGADLVIAGAANLYAQLGDALVQPLPVVLDAAAVTRLDTAGLQLLHAFVDARNEGARPWRWENVGDALRDASARLGLDEMLQLPAEEPVNH